MLHRGERLGGQHVNDGGLDFGGEIGAGDRVQRALPDHRQHRSLQSAEAEVEAAARDHGAWQGKAACFSGRGKPGQGRPAGVAQSEQLGGLVECFARGVIQRLAQEPVLAYSGNVHQLGVAAGNEQCDEGERGRRPGQQR